MGIVTEVADDRREGLLDDRRSRERDEIEGEKESESRGEGRGEVDDRYHLQ